MGGGDIATAHSPAPSWGGIHNPKSEKGLTYCLVFHKRGFGGFKRERFTWIPICYYFCVHILKNRVWLFISTKYFLLFWIGQCFLEKEPFSYPPRICSFYEKVTVSWKRTTLLIDSKFARNNQHLFMNTSSGWKMLLSLYSSLWHKLSVLGHKPSQLFRWGWSTYSWL